MTTTLTKTLHLSLKKEYFDAIKNGTKLLEYRLMTKYWARRLLGRDYDTIILTLGYPPKFDTDRRITLPYKGYTTTRILHRHFGDKPVQVYVIDVSGAPL
jgi:hypothetical protein